MDNKMNLPDNAYKTFEIDQDSFVLNLGDQVDPQTVIGNKLQTGELVTANCWGYISGTILNRDNNRCLVVVTGSHELRWEEIDNPEDDLVASGL